APSEASASLKVSLKGMESGWFVNSWMSCDAWRGIPFSFVPERRHGIQFRSGPRWCEPGHNAGERADHHADDNEVHREADWKIREGGADRHEHQPRDDEPGDAA